MRWKSVKPLEHEIQAAYFQEVRRRALSNPLYNLIFAIGNEERSGNKYNRLRFWREGRVSGVPDTLCAVARHGYHSMYIEFKRPGEYPSDAQLRMMALLQEQGHLVTLFRDWEKAINFTENYLR